MANKENRTQDMDRALKNSNLLKLNRFIANTKVMIFILLIMNIIEVLCVNYATHIIVQLGDDLQKSKEITLTIDYAINQAFDFKLLWSYQIFFWINIALLIYLDIKFAYKIQVSFRDFNKNQKGAGRWTTIKEIQKEYRAIDDKLEKVTDTFSGGGGFPVCHYEGKWYIDDSPVNNLIIGTSRSGKGEMIVFPLINIYSSAEKKASLVVTDPKLELAAASYDTLIERGYEVHILNLIDPINSMGFNPLSRVVDAYKRGDIEEAQLLCSSLCYSIFNPDEAGGDSQFWANTSTFCLSAMILAHTADCLALDKEENEKAQAEYIEKINAFRSLSSEEEKNIQDIWKEIKEKEIEIEKAGLKEFQALKDEILELKEKVKNYQNPEEEFVPTCTHEKEINMNSIINTFTSLARRKAGKDATWLDIYFEARPELDPAKALYSSAEIAGDRTKGSIFANTLSKLQTFTYDAIAKMTAESTLNLEEIGFGDKPIAVFMGIPDFDRSNHFIATIFLRQLYFTLAKKCSLIPSGKCSREVINIIDEFGNMPAIEAMENIVTVCLGRNIRYNLIVQSYSQITKLYKESAQTILENCGNHFFILSNGKETARDFSENLGSETIININRIGGKMSLDKSFTEMTEDKPLLNANELMELRPGECVVKRVMKRTDLKGHPVKPRPIFNTIEMKTEFPYRYTYMQDFFPSENTVASVTKETRLRINLKERIFDWENHMKKISEGTNLVVMERTVMQMMRYEQVKDTLVHSLKRDLITTFYEKLVDILKKEAGHVEITMEDMEICTIDEVMVYLESKPQYSEFSKLAQEWFLLVTGETYEFVEEAAKEKNKDETTSSELSSQNNDVVESSSPATNDSVGADQEQLQPQSDTEFLEEVKDVQLWEFTNSEDLMSMIEKNIDENEIIEAGYMDVSDCTEMTVQELYFMLPEDIRDKYVMLLKRGKQSV